MDDPSRSRDVKLGNCRAKEGKTKGHCKKLGDPSWQTSKVGSKV